MSECGAARRSVWPDAGPKSATGELLRAREHVASCEQCQAFLRDMERMSQITSQSLPRESVPPETRVALMRLVGDARIRGALLDGKGGGARRWPMLKRIALPAAATILLALGVNAVWRSFTAEPGQRGADASLLAAVVSEHGRARSGDRFESTDAAEIKKWIAARVEFAVHVPVFRDAELRGVRLDQVGGRKGVAIEYVRSGDLVSYVIVPDSITAARGRSAGVISVTEVKGYRLAWWVEPDLVHAMVGEVAAGDLRALAEECIRQAMELRRRGIAAARGTQPSIL